jgi:hypothetical protein
VRYVWDDRHRKGGVRRGEMDGWMHGWMVGWMDAWMEIVEARE